MIFLLFFGTALAANCSWEKCNPWSDDKNVINVHLVPHTHDDLGWIKTVDQYYYGTKPDLVPVGVQYIYNTVIDELEKHPDRRFSFAETGFLHRWTSSHGDYDRHRLQKLVKNGQIEIIGGGWVQNDEASSHYVDIIDQMTFGLEKLERLFGECGKPTVGWQIDPFGHSREMANLFAMMGYNALFFWRIHYLEKDLRLRNKSLEFIWNASDDLKTQLLTGAFFQDNYGPPPGFCWDALCGDDPIQDNPQLEEYNVDEKVAEFVKYVRNQSSFLRTNNVMLLMGSDFQYTNANPWFDNMDKLIKYVNANKSLNVNVLYSTPACYVNAVSEMMPHLPNKDDDFFPYASAEHSFWTGYFTSRPGLKGMIRKASSYLQLAKQLDAQFFLGPTDDSDVEIMKKASALTQHHDAVTGTAKENVTRDYELRLHKALTELEQVINDALAVNPSKKAPAQYKLCLLTNETVCPETKQPSVAVTVFNPLGQSTRTVVKIPYHTRGANVVDDKGNKVDVQVSKTFIIPTISVGDTAPFELYLPVEVGPLGYRTYFIKQSANGKYLSPRAGIRTTENDKIFIENQLVRLDFDANGYLESYLDKKTNTTKKLAQQFYFYEGVTDKNDTQPSGAYIFRPLDQNVSSVSTACKLEVTKGELVQEVRQVVNDWVYQVIRLSNGSRKVEFDWVVGPIPKEDKNPITREVVTRYVTDVQSKGVFYTDANGRQMMQRKVNYSPSFTYKDTEPVAGNYYPITSRVYIKDANSQCTVLTDRGQGATSRNGMIEIMLHRRCHTDDHFGVEEALDEPGKDGKGLVAKGSHWLLLGSAKGAADLHRPLAVKKFNEPILAYAPVEDFADYRSKYVTKFDGLTRELPPFVNLLTLEKKGGKTLLLRLEHIYQSSDEATNSKPMDISLKGLFTRFEISAIKELSLAANRNITNFFRLRDDFVVHINPQEIKTFELSVKEN